MKSFLPLIRAEWRLLLFGFAMTFGSSLGQTYFIGLFSGEIRAELGLGHGDFGAIYSAATLASALLLLWSGALIDRIALPRYAALVTVGLAAGCLLMASSRGTLTLFVAILALRQLGQGLMGMTASTTVVRYIDRDRGKATALSGVGYTLSEAVLPSLVIALLALVGWRLSWALWGISMLLVLLPLSRWLLRDHDDRHHAYLQSVNATDANTATRRRHHWTRAEVLADPAFYLFLPALLAQPMLFTGFMFHQVHLVEGKGWPLVAWGGLYVLYAVVATTCKLATGLLVDRFSAIRLAPLVCLPLGLGLFALAASDSFAIAAVFMALVGVSIGMYSTLSSPFYAEMYGTLHLGAIKSLTTATMVFATAIAPALMGILIDRGVSMEQMAFASGAYTLAAAALAWLGQGLARRRAAAGV
jgi:MFS family permease